MIRQLGTDEFYHRLKNEYFSANNTEITLTLYDELLPLARSAAWKYISYRDIGTDSDGMIEDAVMQAIEQVMVIRISDYIELAEEWSEITRIAWFRKVLSNKCYDVLTKVYRRWHGKISSTTFDPTCFENSSTLQNGFTCDVHEVMIPQALSASDSEQKDIELSDPSATPEELFFAKNSAESAFKKLFELPQDPVTILICAYAILIRACEYTGSRHPDRDIADTINGMTVTVLLGKVKDLLSLCGIAIGVLQPLRNRIVECHRHTEIIDTSARFISKKKNELRNFLLRKFEQEEE